jgi:hypothetical protein
MRGYQTRITREEEEEEEEEKLEQEEVADGKYIQ